MSRRETPSNSDNIIDSRDVVTRIEELESEREILADALQEATDARDDSAEGLPPETADTFADAVTDAELALRAWDEGEDGAEFKALNEFADELSGYVEDWRQGATLVRDSHFEDYARDLFADDLGMTNRKERDAWPYTCIDWEAAAEELKQDYTSGEFDGVTYWAR